MFFDVIGLFLSKIFFFTGVVRQKGTFPKPLSPEDEKKYLALARAGNKEAKDMLVKHNMRLVAHIVKKYSGAAETDDLLSVGSIGLIKAINTFQDGKGTQLATYTARCIENEILMLIRSSKKHKNIISINDPVGTDKDGNGFACRKGGKRIFPRGKIHSARKVYSAVKGHTQYARIYDSMYALRFGGRSAYAPARSC